MAHTFYNDYLYKKLKPKSDVLENLLEKSEQKLVKLNEIPSLYHVSIPTQDEVWICGRIFSENIGGGGKLTEHNVLLQGSYVCSNSHSISLNLSSCQNYSLFPGQIILAKGKNPDGKTFIVKEIVEPPFAPFESNKKIPVKKDNLDVDYTNKNNFQVKQEPNENIMIMVASGPYMNSGSLLTNSLKALIDIVKTKNPHFLILLGPFLDINNDLIAGGNIQSTYEELLQIIFDEIASQIKGARTQVLIQPSLADVTQDPIYPIHPFYPSAQFLKQNDGFYFVQEPSIIKINGISLAITSTDVIKDLICSAVHKMNSTDKIARNFMHLLKQRSFYPIYPPPDNIPIDYEAWEKYCRIDTNPDIFISVSDLATFTKEVNNCTCFNPGRLIKGSANGTYAQVLISTNGAIIKENAKESNNETNNSSKASLLPDELSQYCVISQPDNNVKAENPTQTQAQTQSTGPNKNLNVSVTFHKI